MLSLPQGCGVQQSDEEAEKWWLRAAEGRGVGEREEGEWESVVRAQNTLGMFYSRQETLDLEKVKLYHKDLSFDKDVGTHTMAWAFNESLHEGIDTLLYNMFQSSLSLSLSCSHSSGTQELLKMET